MLSAVLVAAMYSSTSSFAGASSASSSSLSSSSLSSSTLPSSLRRSPSLSTASSSASSSLFNFSSYPAYIPPSVALASELDASSVYRGIDHSSSIFALPPQSSARTAAFSLDLFDSTAAFDSSDAASTASSPYAPAAHSQHSKKLDIPAFATLTDLSASDFPPVPLPATSTSTPSQPRPLSPLTVSSEPAYLERYTSFYSSTPAEQLLTGLTSLLTAHHIDHTLSRSKAKLVVSFQCPFLSSLTVTFIMRLYRSTSRPNTLIVEGQRREGCVVAFHHVWDRLVKACNANGLCTGMVEEGQKLSGSDSDSEASVTSGVLGICSLLGNKAAAVSTAHPLSSSSPSPTTSASTPSLPTFQLDASASAILSNLVDNGDITQQRDALRLLSLSLLSSPSASSQCQSFLSRIARWASPASAPSSSAASSASAACLDDERTAQLARLMLICSQFGGTDAFVRQCAHSLFELLESLSRQPASGMSMCRLRGLRCLLQVVGELCRADGGRVLVPYVGSQERAVLERCAGMHDEAVQQESRAVLQRLGAAY